VNQSRSLTLRLARVFRHLLYAGAVVSVFSCNGSLPVDHTKSPAPNLDVMVGLTRNIVRSFVRDGYLLPYDTCWTQFSQMENVLFLENALLESLRNIPVFVSETLPQPSRYVSVAIQPSRVDVTYERAFREGLFGPKYVGRVVTVELSAKIVQHPRGMVHFSGLRREEWRDTVSVSSIEELESPFIKVTQAHVPTETLLDKFLGPIVVLATTGIIVYLFYTVRS